MLLQTYLSVILLVPNAQHLVLRSCRPWTRRLSGGKECAVVAGLGSDPETLTTLVVVALWILWGASAPHTGPSGSTYIYLLWLNGTSGSERSVKILIGSMEPSVPSVPSGIGHPMEPPVPGVFVSPGYRCQPRRGP